MCIIAIKKTNIPLMDEKILKTMFDNNSDGAGFMYNYNNKVIIQKGNIYKNTELQIYESNKQYTFAEIYEAEN